MANPGRTRPASLGPIDPNELPIPQIFPKLRQELDTSGYGASDDHTDYQASVWAIIEDARDYNYSYLQPVREALAQLYDGQIPLVSDEGRSSIVLTEVRDLVLAMLPSLVRQFTSQEHPVHFLPRTEKDIERAEEAMDYVSYVWKYDNPGFLNLNAILKDALIKGTGVAKWWTEREAEIVEQTYTNLTLEQRQFVISEPRTMVVSETRNDLEGPNKVVEPRFDMTVRRAKLTPKHRVEAVPPDEFRISREAKHVSTAALVGHERLVPLSQLVQMGYPAHTLEDDYGSGAALSTAEQSMRNPGGLEQLMVGARDASQGDPMVHYGEWYIRIDKDGDGVPELRKICTIGDSDRIIMDEPAARAKFALFCPDPEPHTAIGHSIAEQVDDLQHIKSNILRNTLDALASTILPRLVVVDTLTNMDDVRNNELGSTIRVKDPTAVTQLQVTPPGQIPIQLLEYLDLIGNRRTGVTEQSKGLDPKAMQSTAKEGVGLLVTGAQERIELVARTLAETGFRDLFKGLLQEITDNPIPERMIRLRDKWTKVTPDAYDATMDVMVNPAIGRGSDEDRLHMLMGIKATQEQIIQSYGVDNPLVSPIEYRNTLVDILEFAAMKNHARYFKVVTPQQLQQALQAQSQKPNPEMVYAQAEADKVRASIVKALTDAKVKTIDMGLTDDRERDKLDAEIAFKAGELAVKGYELDQNTIQMAIDAVRPEAEKASTDAIPEPTPAMFPSMEPQDALLPPGAPKAPESQPAPSAANPGAPPLRPPVPPALNLPPGFGIGPR
jgi:hypothetical protein